MARPKLRLLCTSMLVAILLFLYAALLCSCKTADPEISGTMWVELSLDGQYALTNAAGQTLRYFDLLQYDGTMPVEKTHLNGGEAAYSASLCVPRTETLTVEVTDGSLFSASWEDESQFRKIEGSVRKIVLSDKTTSVEAAGEGGYGFVHRAMTFVLAYMNGPCPDGGRVLSVRTMIYHPRGACFPIA